MKMLKAGILHLDLVTYGNERSGTLTQLLGWYSPIGTESSPNNSISIPYGWPDIAKRFFKLFFGKQHENGLYTEFLADILVEDRCCSPLCLLGNTTDTPKDKEWIEK